MKQPKEITQIKDSYEEKSGNGKSSRFRVSQHSQFDVDASPPLNRVQKLVKRTMAETARGHQDTGRQDDAATSSPIYTRDWREPHFTRLGRKVEIFHQQNPPQVLSEEEDRRLKSVGLANKVKRIEPPINSTDSFSREFANGKGMIEKRSTAQIIIEDNFEPVTTAQVGDLLVYRFLSSREPMYVARVTEVSDEKVSKVHGQTARGGSIFEHHPDFFKDQVDCYWEIIRPKKGASLKSWRELLVPGKDYMTTKGRSLKVVFHPTKDLPAIPPELERQMAGACADQMVEDPTPAYNCFGHGILDKKGLIQNANDIIEDDFILVETPEVGDRLVGRNPETGRAEHMAIIEEISQGEASQVSSKHGHGGLYMYSGETMKEMCKGLCWEIRRKKTSADNNLRREEG
jgi:hypothetical protein